MSIMQRPQGPARMECGLPYHREGSRVQWTRFSREHGRTIKVTGIVVKHERRVITARMDHDGSTERTTCGCVVAYDSPPAPVPPCPALVGPPQAVIA